MHASDGGAALALQPEGPVEETALNRLREIWRRATQYRLPAPYWEGPEEFTELDPDGREALVVRDGAARADLATEEYVVALRVGDGVEFGDPTLRFDEPACKEAPP